MASPKAEQSVWWLGFFASLTFVVALLFTAVFPSMNQNWSTETAKDIPRYHLEYTALQEHGRLVYQREGCMYCHSQQIRPLKSEMIRYGIGTSPAPAADEREYVYDAPHFFGTKRNGPDLSRVGNKYTDDWHLSHLYNPQALVPNSIMPQFTWLFTNKNPADPSLPPVPTRDALALVAYLQTLGSERQVYDPDLNAGHGGWRLWVKPRDTQNRLIDSEAEVNMLGSANAVRIPGGSQAGSVK